MKKLIFLLLIAISAFTVQAQTLQTATPMINSVDSALNATTIYANSGYLPGNLGKLALQLNLTKVSGTVAGAAYLQGSLDGVNYTNVSTTDTLALTDVTTNVKTWDVIDKKRLYYRIKITTTGTQLSKPHGYFTVVK